jgi:transposase
MARSRRREDAKVAALREARTLNPQPETVRDKKFDTSEFFDARDLVQVKYEMVRRVEVDGAAVTHAAASLGFSRPSYYDAAEALPRDGLAGLVPAKPGPRRAHKLTDEVLAYLRAPLAADSSLRAGHLVEAIAARFGTRVRGYCCRGGVR